MLPGAVLPGVRELESALPGVLEQIGWTLERARPWRYAGPLSDDPIQVVVGGTTVLRSARTWNRSRIWPLHRAYGLSPAGGAG